jgi:hypothetical protein
LYFRVCLISIMNKFKISTYIVLCFAIPSLTHCLFNLLYFRQPRQGACGGRGVWRAENYHRHCAGSGDLNWCLYYILLFVCFESDCMVIDINISLNIAS